MKIETYYESKSFVKFGAILPLIADGFPVKLFMAGDGEEWFETCDDLKSDIASIEYEDWYVTEIVADPAGELLISISESKPENEE